MAAYVKNDHLGFTIPYVHEGRSHDYVPDFLVRLKRRDDEDFDRTLIVEVSGGQKSALARLRRDRRPTTARDSWCVAVNNHGGFGRWGYIEMTDPVTAQGDASPRRSRALYADDGRSSATRTVLDYQREDCAMRAS